MVWSREVLLEAASLWLILSLLGACCGESQGLAQSIKNTNSKEVKKFGCVFQDEKYNVPTDSIFSPVYGEEVETMDFATTQQFGEVLDAIKEVYANVMEDVVVTNIPEYLDFYDAYKADSRPGYNNFKQFFKGYVPKFYPKQGIASKVIELLDRLIKRFPNMEKNVHLITASLNINGKLIQVLNNNILSDGNNGSSSSGLPEEQSLKEEPPKILFRHDHVAALLRIRIGERLGYVLMDPVDFVDRPVVIMKDKQDPHLPSAIHNKFADQEENMEFDLLHKGYITSLTLNSDTVKSSPDYVYYISKPYCSFLMTTAKRDIPSEFKFLELVRSNLRGLEIAAIRYHSTPGQYSRNIHTRLRIGNVIERNDIPIDSIQSFENESQYFKKLMKTLNYDGDIIKIMQKAKTIAEDQDFYENIKKLNGYILHLFHLFYTNKHQAMPDIPELPF